MVGKEGGEQKGGLRGDLCTSSRDGENSLDSDSMASREIGFAKDLIWTGGQ